MLDGYYGIVTSDTGLNAQEIADIHHGLWKIEESFRVMKTNLEARPCYVWTEKSIKGHFVSCYIAFLLQRLLEYKLKAEGKTYSTDKVISALQSANIAEVEASNKVPVYLKINTNSMYDERSSVFKMEPLGRYNTKQYITCIPGVLYQ